MATRVPLRRRLSRLLQRVARLLDVQESEQQARMLRLRRSFPEAPEAWIAAVAACGEPAGPMQAARLSRPPGRPSLATHSPWNTPPPGHREGRGRPDGLSSDPSPAPPIVSPTAKPQGPRLVFDHVAPCGAARERALFHGRPPLRPAPAALADLPPPPSPAPAPIPPPPGRRPLRFRAEFHRDTAPRPFRPDPPRDQSPAPASADATARNADFSVLQAEREHPVDPASFALPEPKAWHRSLGPPPSPPPRSAGESVPPRLPPAPGPTAEARFPQPLPRPPALSPLPPAASSPARASEAVPELPHPWPALPARPDPPAPPATGRWAEPLPDQERRGWSA